MLAVRLPLARRRTCTLSCNRSRLCAMRRASGRERAREHPSEMILIIDLKHIRSVPLELRPLKRRPPRAAVRFEADSRLTLAGAGELNSIGINAAERDRPSEHLSIRRRCYGARSHSTARSSVEYCTCAINHWTNCHRRASGVASHRREAKSTTTAARCEPAVGPLSMVSN